MSEAVIVALISGAVTLAGIVASYLSTMNKIDKNSEIADEKLKGRMDVLQADLRTLSNRVDAHNRVVERTYALEARAAAVDAKLDAMERSGHHED